MSKCIKCGVSGDSTEIKYIKCIGCYMNFGKSYNNTKVVVLACNKCIMAHYSNFYVSDFSEMTKNFDENKFIYCQKKSHSINICSVCGLLHPTVACGGESGKGCGKPICIDCDILGYHNSYIDPSLSDEDIPYCINCYLPNHYKSILVGYRVLYEKYIKSEEKNNELEKKIEEFRYQPGGPGYTMAKRDFESCIKN